MLVEKRCCLTWRAIKTLALLGSETDATPADMERRRCTLRGISTGWRSRLSQGDGAAGHVEATYGCDSHCNASLNFRHARRK